MTFLRRFLVLIAFAFWQGGFTFYAGVVVPVGRAVDAEAQSLITTAVTNWLNLAGAIALVILTWDALERDPARGRRRVRLAMCGIMLLILGLLAWLHVELERDFYRPYHKLYLWASTMQWACGLVYLALMLWTWRAQDRGA